MRTQPTDALDRILRMGTAGSWILFALFALTHTTLAVFAGGPPMTTAWGWLALAAILAGGAWSVWPGPYPMPGWWAACVVVLIVSGTTAITWQLDPTSWPGYASWNFGAIAFICFALSLRGRTIAGWIGLLAQTASAMLWSLTIAGDAWPGFALSYRHLGTYLAGSLLAIGIHATARRNAEYRDVERRAVADAAALEAGRIERAAELNAVREIAAPALRRIAALQGNGHEEEFRRTEATLRDRIRAPRLALSPLRESIERARRRGVDVAVFDDTAGEELRAEELFAASTQAAAELDAWDPGEGAATVRLAGRGPAATLTVTSVNGRSSAHRVGGSLSV